LLVFEFASINGGERSIEAVLPNFVGTDFEFVALAPPRGAIVGALQAIGIPVVPFDVRDNAGNRRPAEHILEDFQAKVRHVGPDLVHGNSLSIGRLTGSLARQTGVVCTAHLRDIVGLSAAAVEQLNANQALVAVSNAVRDFHVAQGIDPSRLHVIYNGIDGRNVFPLSPTGWLKAELGLPAETSLMATIGQICLRKGQDVFSQAAVRVAQKMSDAHFLIVGERYSAKPESITFEEAISQEFARAGVADRLHRLGFRNDVSRILGEIDLLVHCARQEPFGRVLLEAAAVGCPIVATNVGGTAELLVDGESALLVPADQPDALAAAILKLHGDPLLRHRLARAARERIVERFPIEKAARELAELWRATLSD
jgi:glycosyltransferase involved in cell wall biosynthesis